MRGAMGNTTVKRALEGRASLSSSTNVGIANCLFQFLVPLLGGTIASPANIRTSRPGKNNGLVSCDVPSVTPLAPCRIIPNY